MMYFVDPDLKKNKNYYRVEIKKLAEFYGVTLYLFYGPEFFAYVGQPTLWDDLISWLVRWKSELPDLPEVNFDLDSQASFEEIKSLNLRYWRKLILNDRLWDEGIMQVLFNDGATLRLLLADFNKNQSTPYRILSETLSAKLDKYYS